MPPGGRSVGILMNGRGMGPARLFPHIQSFERRLGELGYAFASDDEGVTAPGRDLVLEYRWADPWDAAAAALGAAALVEARCSVIVTSGSMLTLAVKQRTDTIPIVMICDDGDCVGAGLVASLERPGGNVTGSTSAVARLSGKRLELLAEACPPLSRVGVLYNPSVPDKASDLARLEATAADLRVELVKLPVQQPDAIPGAFETARLAGAEALLTLSDALVFMRRKQLVELAAQHRLPAIYTHRASVLAGGLMSYGPNMADLYARAADYIDRVLGGARPADLPVAEPDGFELVVNPATAQALGVTLPPSLLAKVDALVP
jgi:putative ABC transport system substrate-binding protein